ncbi:MAG: caspase family protein, partial [Magnetovibrio sp.]|nr:caspase family protein [Magnetovibrio sp.]
IKTFEASGQKLGGIALAVWSNNGRLLHGVADPQGIRKDNTVVLEQTLHTWDRRGQYLGRTKLSEMGITSPLTSLNLESQNKLLFGTSSGDWGRLSIDRTGQLAKDINVPTNIPNYRNLYKARLRTDASGALVTFPTPKNGLPAKIFNAEARELVRASDLFDRLDKITNNNLKPALSINLDDGLATYDGQIIPIRAKERALDVIAARKGNNIYLGTNFFVRAYVGRTEIWKVATSAPVWGVTPSGNDKVLIAYLGNGVIQWHDTQNGRLLRSLFVTRDSKHWVMWTPDGFFDHSATDKNGLSGAELVGFHINNGYKDEAVFVSINQLYQKYYRPDAVQAALQTQAGDDLIVASALKDSTDTITTLRDSLPPKLVNFEVCGIDEFDEASGCSTLQTSTTTRTLRAVLPQPVRDSKFIELILDVKDSGGGAGKIKVRRNGATIATEQIERIDQKFGYSTRERIQILPGENRLEIVALNAAQDVESPPISFTINSPRKQGNTKKTLYILAVGIADYSLDMLDLQENIAANDARDMAKIFAAAAGPNGVYKNVETQVLVDKQATRPAILKALSSLADKVQSSDTVIIFLSGHGDVVDRDYTFATYEWGTASTDLIARVMKGRRFLDSSVRDIYRREGLSQSSFMEKIERMASKNVLIILDTCYAGSFTASSPSQRNAYSSTVAARMKHESGRFVLASARGLANDSDGKDYPKGLGHGLFTSNAIDALSGQADYNNNTEVSLDEFGSYVKDKVALASQDWEVPQVPVIQFEGDPYFPLIKVNQK